MTSVQLLSGVITEKEANHPDLGSWEGSAGSITCSRSWRSFTRREALEKALGTERMECGEVRFGRVWGLQCGWSWRRFVPGNRRGLKKEAWGHTEGLRFLRQGIRTLCRNGKPLAGSRWVMMICALANGFWRRYKGRQNRRTGAS